MILEVKGLSDLQRRLKALPERIQRVTLIKAVRAGATPILAAAQAMAPRRSGLLASRIAVKFTRRGINRVEAGIGVFGLTKRQRAKGVGDPYYALFVEKGHDIVRRGADAWVTKRLHVRGGGTGGVLGHVAPRPFLRPALEANIQTATNLVGQVLREEIDRAEHL